MGNVDLSLIKDEEGIYDLQIEGGDFKTNDSFETAIQMSIFAEERADSSEVPIAELRRGWWGNTANRVIDYQIGSKLWQLEQARRTPTTLNLAIDYARNALQWLIDDGHATNVEVAGEFSDDGIRLFIEVSRPQNKVTNVSFELWNNTVTI
jgi:phage gp46-like protein